MCLEEGGEGVNVGFGGQKADWDFPKLGLIGTGKEKRGCGIHFV